MNTESQLDASMGATSTSPYKGLVKAQAQPVVMIIKIYDDMTVSYVRHIDGSFEWLKKFRLSTE